MLLGQPSILEVKRTLRRLEVDSSGPIDKASSDLIDGMYDLWFPRCAGHCIDHASTGCNLRKGFVRLRAARKVLRWNTPKREARHFDENDMISMKKLKTLCIGLIEVDESSQTVRLVHSTLQGYIPRRHQDSVSETHLRMAMVGLEYPSIERFDVVNEHTNDRNPHL
ncbi:hypothetical protein HO173_008142 [Letharia columbiana]|uniref:Uncharacterized protein n=1 Tax=Letharia columbiana TaxID=112416 RepID=A0A8H6FS21_9LECA|nr:uncharacterized protein HO173_008142 [Letharia columbiana]KAF6233585.1 hypothetical protein HO173_008142 [Letharia columbiana]